MTSENADLRACRRARWRRACLFGSIVAATLMTAHAVEQRDAKDPHGVQGRCDACHFGEPPKGASVPTSGAGEKPATRYALRYDRERAVCERCHSEHNEPSHPVEVKPTVQTPQGWPLDSAGHLVCSTCHDPHRAVREGAKAASRRLLRGDKEGPAFCQQCHGAAPRGDRRAWHMAVALSAHGHAGADPGAPAHAGLDPLSARCIACHDGTSGPTVGFRLGQRHLDLGRNGSHPIGVRYAPDAQPPQRGGEGPRLRSLAALDPRIRLSDGQVGCGSCHDVFSKLPKFLTVDTKDGQLCRACHDM